MKFHERLRMIRKENNMLQKDIAELLQMPQNTYSGYETGSRLPNIDIIIQIAKILDCSVDYLVGNSDNKKAQKNITADYVTVIEHAKDYEITPEKLKAIIDAMIK